MESASGEPRWPAFTRTPYSYPGSLFTVLEARSRRSFGAWPRRVAVRRRRTLIFGRRTSTERLAADPRPHRVGGGAGGPGGRPDGCSSDLFGAWPRRVAVRRRRTLIFGRRTSTERLAADPRPHRVGRAAGASTRWCTRARG